MQTIDSKNIKFVVGIDVSKDSLTYSIFDGKIHTIKEITYNYSTIKKELINKFKSNKDKVIFLMESTGIYHNEVANYLLKSNYKVSVVNPLTIKRFAQMHLNRVKTDKADAKLIAAYAYLYKDNLKPFKAKSKEQKMVNDTIKAIDDLNHQKTILNNQYKALLKDVNSFKKVLNSYKKHIEFINKEIKKLEKLLKSIITKEFKKEYELLNSINGVGVKLIATIISILNSFKTFDNSKRACRYIGITPAIYESGTSVKGKASITKRGNPFARKVLYMATLSATIHNPLIKEYYNRLISKGKAKMTALIACANKLLRIAYGVLKNNTKFNPNYLVDRV